MLVKLRLQRLLIFLAVGPVAGTLRPGSNPVAGLRAQIVDRAAGVPLGRLTLYRLGDWRERRGQITVETSISPIAGVVR